MVFAFFYFGRGLIRWFVAVGDVRLDRIDAIDAIVFAVMRLQLMLQLMLLGGSGRVGRFWSRCRQHIGDREEFERRKRI